MYCQIADCCGDLANQTFINARSPMLSFNFPTDEHHPKRWRLTCYLCTNVSVGSGGARLLIHYCLVVLRITVNLRPLVRHYDLLLSAHANCMAPNTHSSIAVLWFPFNIFRWSNVLLETKRKSRESSLPSFEILPCHCRTAVYCYVLSKLVLSGTKIR